MKPILWIILAVILFCYGCWLQANPFSSSIDKYTLLSYVPKEVQLETQLYQLNQRYSYPFVIKPNICSGTNRSVAKISSDQEWNAYQKQMDPNDTYMIQTYYPSKYEVGLLYERNPFQKKGRIISIVMKQSRDNEWKPLKCDTFYDRKGTDCTNRTDLMTPELESRIDEISKGLPDFYVGRYDIGFDDIEAFRKGQQFKIYEVNGVMGFDLRWIIIGSSFLSKVYYICRWMFKRIGVGLGNIILGRGKSMQWKHQWNYYQQCRNYEFLLQPSAA